METDRPDEIQPSRREAFPLSIRIVAWLLVMAGSGSLTSAVAGIFRGSLQIDLLAPLLIWLAIRLLKRSSGARPWGLAFGLFTLFGSIAMVVALLVGFEGVAIGDFQASAFPPWYLFFLCQLAFAMGLFTVIALRRLRRRGWFLPPGSPEPAIDPQTRRGLWMAGALGAVLALGFQVGLAALDRLTTDQEWSTGSTTGQHAIAYGTRYGKLAYVVFRKVRGNVLAQTVHRGSRKGQAAIQVEGVPRIPLPARTQIHEIVDGRYRTTDRTVTLEELEAFMAAKDPGDDMDSLLRFVDALRAAADGGGTGR
jgi:hypothetical protein